MSSKSGKIGIPSFSPPQDTCPEKKLPCETLKSICQNKRWENELSKLFYWNKKATFMTGKWWYCQKHVNSDCGNKYPCVVCTWI